MGCVVVVAVIKSTALVSGGPCSCLVRLRGGAIAAEMITEKTRCRFFFSKL